MAHRLAGEKPPDGSSVSNGETNESGSNELLTRRNYIQLSAVATAAVAGVASTSFPISAANDDIGESFATDFSEYAQ